MFKKNFIKLCNEKGVAPTVVCNEIGLSSATFSCWTDESVPRKTTLYKLADYFGVTVDYLLGKDDNVPTEYDKTKAALFKDIDQMNEEQLKMLSDYVDFMKSRNKP